VAPWAVGLESMGLKIIIDGFLAPSVVVVAMMVVITAWKQMED
jgi:hypothetical protein